MDQKLIPIIVPDDQKFRVGTRVKVFYAPSLKSSEDNLDEGVVSIGLDHEHKPSKGVLFDSGRFVKKEDLGDVIFECLKERIFHTDFPDSPIFNLYNQLFDIGDPLLRLVYNQPWGKIEYDSLYFQHERSNTTIEITMRYDCKAFIATKHVRDIDKQKYDYQFLTFPEVVGFAKKQVEEMRKGYLDYRNFDFIEGFHLWKLCDPQAKPATIHEEQEYFNLLPPEWACIAENFCAWLRSDAISTPLSEKNIAEKFLHQLHKPSTFTVDESWAEEHIEENPSFRDEVMHEISHDLYKKIRNNADDVLPDLANLIAITASDYINQNVQKCLEVLSKHLESIIPILDTTPKYINSQVFL